MLISCSPRTTGWLAPAALAALLAGSTLGCSSDANETDPPPPEVPADFLPVCAMATVACNAALAPPSIAGDYSGTGETVLTTSELWSVGNSESFTVNITSQTDGLVSGHFQMESFELTVDAAEIRGTGNAFTIYGMDSVDSDDCQLEARVVISGTADNPTTPTTLTGELTLLFTDNIVGPGCTAEQIANYPGTGANFSYTATRGI